MTGLAGLVSIQDWADFSAARYAEHLHVCPYCFITCEATCAIGRDLKAETDLLERVACGPRYQG